MSDTATNPPELGHWAGSEAIRVLAQRFPFKTVLDIGAGEGVHSRWLAAIGKSVTSICYSASYGFQPDIVGDYMDTEFNEPFDAIWASHVLEHQLNAGAFLKKIYQDLKPTGILAITVPPMKPEIVGGHVSLWNAGLLLYNLILAGFDCRDAAVHSYGYNVSVIVRKRRVWLPRDLTMDAGDIEKLAAFFPLPVHQAFDGAISDLNWSPEPDLRAPPGPAFDASALSIGAFRDLSCPFKSDLEALLWAFRAREIDGTIAEFGVFKGRSINALAAATPEHAIWGFDSFEGLPEPWVRSDTSTYESGHFALTELPEVAASVRLVKGFFSDTLAPWASAHAEPVSFLHIDADLRASALHVLETLNHLIAPGTVIVFDELCDWKESGVYPRWREGEWSALLDWMAARNRSVRVLARGPDYSGSVIVAR